MPSEHFYLGKISTSIAKATFHAVLMSEIEVLVGVPAYQGASRIFNCDFRVILLEILF